jgi:hypothetical protein
MIIHICSVNKDTVSKQIWKGDTSGTPNICQIRTFLVCACHWLSCSFTASINHLVTELVLLFSIEFYLHGAEDT